LLQIYATDCNFQNKYRHQILFNNIKLIDIIIAETDFIIIIATNKIEK